MSLSFPASPTVGQQYGDWVWNGQSWDSIPAAAPSGDRVLIASQTVSAAVASVDFLTGIGDGTYDEYEIRIYDLLLATENIVQMRVSTDGVTFDAGSTNYLYSWVNGNTTGASAAGGAAGVGQIQLGPAQGISTQFAYYGIIRWFVSKLTRPSCSWQAQAHNSSAAFAINGAGEYAATTGPNIIKGFRFNAAANITRGTFKLFGISRGSTAQQQGVAPQPGARVQLQRQDVASAVASVDFTTGVDWVNYERYEIVCYGVQMSTAVGLALRTSSNAGSTWDSAASQYAATSIYNASAAGTPTGSSGSATQILISTSQDVTALRHVASLIDFFQRPAGQPPLFLYRSEASTASGGIFTLSGTGWNGSNANPINGLRFLPSAAGNITAGTFIIYGVAK